MNSLGRRVFVLCLLVASAALTPEKAQAMTPEAQDLYQQGVAAANENTWPVALEYFTKAHKLARNEASLYYALGVAHDKAGNALPGMAWYLAYMAGKTEPEKAAFARKRIDELDFAVQNRLVAIFDSALKIARVSGPDQRPDIALLKEIASSQQASGFIEASAATRQIIKDSVGIRTWSELPHSAYLKKDLQRLDANVRYVLFLVEAGNIAALRKDKTLATRVGYDETGKAYAYRDETLLVAEIRHFVLMSDPLSRVRLAEGVSRHDPLRNIDVKIAAALDRKADEKAKDVVGRITWLADRISEALQQIRALLPSDHDSPYLSPEAQDYLKRALDYKEGNDGGSLYWATGSQQLLRKAWFAGAFVSDAADENRLAIYNSIDALITFDQMDDKLLFGITGENPIEIQGGFRALVWTKKDRRTWKVHRIITSNDFKKGMNRDRWVNEIDSFDPKKGLAILVVGENDAPTPSGTRSRYSRRVWDLINNKQVKFLEER